MGFDARHSVEAGLRDLGARLQPILIDHMAALFDTTPWTVVLEEVDILRGREPGDYDLLDLESQLAGLTVRLGELGHPFGDSTGLRARAVQLRFVRNRWAHEDAEWDAADAWRAHEWSVQLLTYFGDEEGARRAAELRDQAGAALAELGEPTPEAYPNEVPSTRQSVLNAAHAGPKLATRTNPDDTPLLGSARAEYDPWPAVQVDDRHLLEDFRRQEVKEKVAAVTREIVEFEGPIRLERLISLLSVAFGALRRGPGRAVKFAVIIKQTGLLVDADGWVWPERMNPNTWAEFRINDSTMIRQFTEISPVEIGNAIRCLRRRSRGITQAVITPQILAAFGRRWRRPEDMAHLGIAQTQLAIRRGARVRPRR